MSEEIKITKEQLETQDRPIQKLVEHIQDALWHLHASDLPAYVKSEIDSHIQATGRVLSEAIHARLKP